MTKAQKALLNLWKAACQQEEWVRSHPSYEQSEYFTGQLDALLYLKRCLEVEASIQGCSIAEWAELIEELG